MRGNARVRDVPGIPAEYKQQRTPEYRGNPAIEALPPIATPAEAARRLAYRPLFDDSLRDDPSYLRKHHLIALLRFRYPFDRALVIEDRVARLIRGGYVGRNPVWPGRTLAIGDAARNLANSPARTTTLWAPPSAGSREPKPKITGLHFLGHSGSGKSTVIEDVLAGYPQVLRHVEYRGRPFICTQVVHLKVDCPEGAALRSLCVSVLRQIDRALGLVQERSNAGRRDKWRVPGIDAPFTTRYLAERADIDELIEEIGHVFGALQVGILTIDEIQHLCQALGRVARHGRQPRRVLLAGGRRLLNFFVNLSNRVGVPVVLIGTPAAWDAIAGEFRQVRRGETFGDAVWDRLPQDKEWDSFCQQMWEYQFTHTRVPLTSSLSLALYDESQGIVDLAVKLFGLAQVRVMEVAESPGATPEQVSEVLTPDVIRSVAADSLRMSRRVIQLLRTQPDDAHYEVEDVLPGALRQLGAMLNDGRTHGEAASPALARSVEEHSVHEDDGAAGDKLQPPGRRSCKSPGRARPAVCHAPGELAPTSRAQDAPSDDLNLMELVRRGREVGISAYETLVRAHLVATGSFFSYRVGSWP